MLSNFSKDRKANLRVKICGITQPEQGRAIAELGATALGFICAPTSPRYVTAQQIADVVLSLPINLETGKPCCDRIGVFVNADLELICQVVALGHLNGVQLHGDETPELCDRLRQALPGVELIKALRIQSMAALEATQLYQNSVNTLLLDAYHPTLAGGTGKTLDWSALQQFRPTIPWFLAGGLSPDNILEALAYLNPNGIDLSSGVEISPGNKNLNQVAQLLNALQPTLNVSQRDYQTT
ncbi:phosphoribosylanthranilate isomerase [Phormidium sp. CLA17]|uniref:phosphoribosylanthranilate isomerase n=1 Tax=Leptolyngbya sp. Cla-17 TaxID=2803751 RepID=UPI0014911CCA|nr:phosphoribosylanthranilate isomerase [Leptolyngbya sp. Cla-17]MBM0741784.1 phosphoribosylanthranilate isomerase [Leptolyngbya sp. Cla-17]